MTREGLGLVGGAAADRPVVSTLVLAFGLTALAVIGGDDAMGASAIRQPLIDILVSAGAIVGAPLLLCALAPGRRVARMGLAFAIAALAAAAILIQPARWLAAPAAMAASIVASGALAVVLVTAVPAFGALSRLAFVPLAAALLGSAAASGFFAIQGQAESPAFGASAGLALALGSAIGCAALSDFTREFTQGADRRTAAGRAAQDGVGLVVFSVIISAAAFGLLSGEAAGGHLVVAGLAGAAALLTTVSALVVSGAALSLRRSSEVLAVEENLRRQSFREYWRPIRRALSPAAANAAVAVAAIAVMAIALNMTAPISIALVLFIVVAGALAGLVLFSLRAGLFVFFSMLVAVVAVKWIWREVGAPEPTMADEAAALAFTAVLYGQLALCWREARSPRLNPRETTEAAMTEAFRLYVVSALVGMTAFFALSAAHVWPLGAIAAAEAGVLLTIGLVLGPALMTALSNAVRRELA